MSGLPAAAADAAGSGAAPRFAGPPIGADALDPHAAATAASIERERRTAINRAGRRPRVGLRIARSSICPPIRAAAHVRDAATGPSVPAELRNTIRNRAVSRPTTKEDG